MTVGDFIASGTEKLTKAGIKTARLDCLLLLEDALHADRASLLAHPEKILPPQTEVKLSTKIVQRASHTPMAYIRGRVMFYGRTFRVTRDVLVPRPESENIITLLKELSLPKKPQIADVGTGSGCLGITAALEIPSSQIWMYDIDAKALAVAKHNASEYHVSAHPAQSDLLKDNHANFDVILANLPYVPAAYPVNRAAKQEPALALFAGKDGLDLYERFWQQIALQAEPPTFVIIESLPGQHQSLAKFAASAGYNLTKIDGLVQCFQLVSRSNA